MTWWSLKRHAERDQRSTATKGGAFIGGFDGSSHKAGARAGTEAARRFQFASAMLAK